MAWSRSEGLEHVFAEPGAKVVKREGVESNIVLIIMATEGSMATYR